MEHNDRPDTLVAISKKAFEHDRLSFAIKDGLKYIQAYRDTREGKPPSAPIADYIIDCLEYILTDAIEEQALDKQE